MKKLMVLLLALAMLATISACKGSGNNGGSSENGQNEINQSADNGTAESQEETDDAEKPETPDGEDEAVQDENADKTDGDTAGTEQGKDDGEKVQATLSHTDVTLKAAGNSFTLSVKGIDGAYSAIYTSADSAIASVNEKGLVTAVAPGTTTISVQVEREGEKYDLSCVVRCNWKADSSNSGSSTGSDSGSAASVDLSTFYSDMTGKYEFPKLQAFTGDVLESYYPGMGAVSTKQCLVMGSMLTMNNGEFCLVEVSDSKDVETVKSIFQSRIDYMVNGGAWYPEPTDMWTNNSRVVSNGNYVMMVVHENCDDIVDAFNALFA